MANKLALLSILVVCLTGCSPYDFLQYQYNVNIKNTNNVCPGSNIANAPIETFFTMGNEKMKPVDEKWPHHGWQVQCADGTTVLLY